MSLDLSRVIFLLLAVVPGIVVCGSLIYLLVLLAAALFPVRRGPGHGSPDASRTPPRLAVVIPAHNEELVLAATLHSLRQQDYAPDCVDVVVVADNCTDATAALAREWGATVLERENTAERGKGYALGWVFAQLLAPGAPTAGVEACVILDADTQPAPDFLSIMAERLALEAGNGAIGDADLALQGRYGVLNPREGWRTALMSAAFDLCNHVRLLGAANLGLSVGLKGNGMAFSRALLEKAPWQGCSITEDIDYGLDLLQKHNVRVLYEPTARVWAQMPESAAPAASQRERWERGRYRLLRRRVPGLLLQSLRLRRPALFVAAADLMIPPLAELLGLLVVAGIGIAVGIGMERLTWAWAWAWMAAAAAFVVYVLAGLRAAGAKAETFRALLHVPLYVAWKLALYLSRFVGGRVRRVQNPATSTPDSSSAPESPDEWIRTERTALPVAAAPPRGPALVAPTVKGSSAVRAAFHEEQRP